MVIVDDHLALLAIAGVLPELEVVGPVATTYRFQFRMARAVADSARRGSLSRRIPNPADVVARVLNPPSHRLVVLDPRRSMNWAVEVAIRHGANLLLAEFVGAALSHGAALRVTPANRGRTWPQIMDAEGIDFATIEP